MTIDEFIERLRETPREGWKMASGCIRFLTTNERSCCPLTAVDDFRWSDCDFWRASESLGVSKNDSERIVDAADACFSFDPALRARLLEAVGLEETDA